MAWDSTASTVPLSRTLRTKSCRATVTVADPAGPLGSGARAFTRTATRAASAVATSAAMENRILRFTVPRISDGLVRTLVGAPQNIRTSTAPGSSVRALWDGIAVHRQSRPLTACRMRQPAGPCQDTRGVMHAPRWSWAGLVVIWATGVLFWTLAAARGLGE